MNTMASLSGNVIELLKKNNNIFFIESEYPEPNWYMKTIVYIINKFLYFIWLLFIFRSITLMIYIIHNMKNMVNSDFDGKILLKKDTNNDDNNDKMFSDVAGCDEAKQELEEIIEFLKNPEEFEAAGAKIPAGILLEGPPGTGKTLLARATANEADVNFIYATGSEFVEMYVGVGASRVRQMFEKAEKRKPCIIFIDEIDAIGGSRSDRHGGNSERDQTLNQLLTNMDGFQTRDGIIVMAATNRAEILDKALTRNGRFDRKVTVGIPDKKGRQQILKVHLENKSLEKDCNLESIYELTTGFSGAELANLTNEAAILSVRYHLSYITEKCFIDAYEKNTIGLPKKTDNRPKENIKMVAYHEGGHTITALFFKHIFNVRRVTINANNTGAGGYTLFTPKEEFAQFPTKRFMLANIIISLGGRAAEMVLYKEKDKTEHRYNDSIIFQKQLDLDVTTGASNDLKQANQLARSFVTKYGLGKHIGLYDNDDSYDNKLSDSTKKRIDDEIEKIVSTALNIALKIIECNRKSLDTLSEMLIHYTTVNEDQLNDKITIEYDLDK
jgi:cell division protease FtsH